MTSPIQPTLIPMQEQGGISRCDASLPVISFVCQWHEGLCCYTGVGYVGGSSSSYLETIEEGLHLSRILQSTVCGIYQKMGVRELCCVVPDEVFAPLLQIWHAYFSQCPEGKFIQYYCEDGASLIAQALLHTPYKNRIFLVGINSKSIIPSHNISRCCFEKGRVSRDGIIYPPHPDARGMFSLRANDPAFIPCIQMAYLNAKGCSDTISESCHYFDHTVDVYTQSEIILSRQAEGLFACLKVLDYTVLLLRMFGVFNYSELRPNSALVRQEGLFFDSFNKGTIAFSIAFWGAISISYSLLLHCKNGRSSQMLKIIVQGFPSLSVAMNILELMNNFRLMCIESVANNRALLGALTIYNGAYLTRAIVGYSVPYIRGLCQTVARKALKLPKIEVKDGQYYVTHLFQRGLCQLRTALGLVSILTFVGIFLLHHLLSDNSKTTSSSILTTADLVHLLLLVIIVVTAIASIPFRRRRNHLNYQPL